MIVSCPNCAVRFEVPQSALGTAGRKVKCSSCAHVWLQRPDGGTAPLPTVAAPPAPQAAPPAAEPAPPEAEPAADLGAEAAPRRRRFGRTAELEPSSRPPRRRRALAVGAFVVLIAAVGGGAWWSQGGGPLLDRLTAVLSGGPELPGQGLNFDKVETKRRTDAGVTVLIVTGEVVNTSAEPRAVPALKGSLLGPNSRELQSWTFNVPVERLEAGQRAKFETSLRQPAAEATDIKVTFVAPGT